MDAQGRPIAHLSLLELLELLEPYVQGEVVQTPSNQRYLKDWGGRSERGYGQQG